MTEHSPHIDDPLDLLVAWCENLDRMADDRRTADGFVKVTRMLWLDQIRPVIRAARAVLDERDQ